MENFTDERSVQPGTTFTACLILLNNRFPNFGKARLPSSPISIIDKLCETKTTYEHALQVASRQKQETSLYSCLEIAQSAEPPKESVIFCSTEQFCGLGVEPNKTGALSNLNNITCSIFLLDDMVTCSMMNQTLDANGKRVVQSFSTFSIQVRMRMNVTTIKGNSVDARDGDGYENVLSGTGVSTYHSIMPP